MSLFEFNFILIKSITPLTQTNLMVLFLRFHFRLLSQLSAGMTYGRMTNNTILNLTVFYIFFFLETCTNVKYYEIRPL